MSKVFTITEGLENMGAMKTGGQGSVYKGRRTGEIITAIKLLPTPIIDPGPDDKNYKDFLNEVEKLKCVNETPHPNVVTILSSGVSDTGNFPFIEMEYIEGPDLEDLLKPPHEKIFKISEVCKVAEQVSNALAHCHKYGVKHGDIKSNNIKFNVHTGNYVLLDFGLSVMSDEQRRTSLRMAGAIEFMAPEQNEGEVRFETDIYSFGIILFELIAGRVPFPLNDKTESARNTVRLSHMETEVPDMIQLRLDNLPLDWPEEKKEREMHVPQWLMDTVYKCLEKDPAKRFKDGQELHNHILQERHASVKNDEVLLSQVDVMKKMNQQLLEEVEALKKEVKEREKNGTKKGAVLAPFAATSELADSAYATPEIENRQGRSVSRNTFMVVLILAIAFAGLAAFAIFGRGDGSKGLSNTYAVGNDSSDSAMREAGVLPAIDVVSEDEKSEDKKPEINDITEAPIVANTVTPTDTAKKNVEDTAGKKENAGQQNAQQEKQDNAAARYRVTSKAYFYSKADEGSRTNEYIIPTGFVVVKALEDKGDFILVKFKDDRGETTEGWIRKNDLSRLN